MITETGNNLSILVVTETGKDWETFASWYSFYKNLPKAEYTIACLRNTESPFQYYQWTKRLKIKTFHLNPLSYEDNNLNWLQSIRICLQRNLIGRKILVIDPLIMATSVLEPKILQTINNESLISDGKIWFLNEPNIDELLNDYVLESKVLPKSPENLCVEAKETEEPSSLISLHKGCGRWIHTLKGCPFSNAAGLASKDMTANENRIIELWKRMCSIYNAVK